MEKIAMFPGRFNPAQKGHIYAAVWLFLEEEFDKIIFGIGSCYEAGTARHPLLAFMREKMLGRSIMNENISPSHFSFVHLQDFYDWDLWWNHIVRIAEIKKVTHLVTGNEEDILSVIKSKGLKMPFKLINPEKEMPDDWRFRYRATDLRNAIACGDYDLFEKIAATGTVELMGSIGGFSTIRQALENNGTRFISGRQTVDIVITCRNAEGKLMVLTGYRKKTKENFPGWLAIPGGAIEEYENPMDEVVRETGEETGLDIRITNRYLEPAHVVVKSKKGSIISELRFVSLFSTEDVSLAGNQGGSSQLFHIDLDVRAEYFDGMLKSNSDLEQVAFRPVEEVLEKGLAYQQTEMLKKALGMI